MSKAIPYLSSGNYYNTDVSSMDQYYAEQERLNKLAARRLNADDFVPDEDEYWGNALTIGGAGASLGSSIGGAIGTAVGGPVGTALGGAIGGGVGFLAGAGAGVWKTAVDERNIRSDVALNNAVSKMYADDANRRLGYMPDIIQNSVFRTSEAHAVADGGQIERKQISLKEFENMITNRKPVSPYSESNRVVRTYCKGGVKISFK